MRNLRFRSAVTAATALVAALALTACDPEVNTTPDAASSAAGESAPAAGEKQQSSAGTDGNDEGDTGADDTAKGGDKGGDEGGDAGTACTGSNTKVTVTEVSKPINHLLVTATNTSDQNCDAFFAPFLRFDDAQSPAQIIEDSKPQSVISVPPGESAWASISLNGDGNPDIPASELVVSFAGRSNQGSVGTSTDALSLPAGTNIANDTSVSFWQSSLADALVW